VEEKDTEIPNEHEETASDNDHSSDVSLINQDVYGKIL